MSINETKIILNRVSSTPPEELERIKHRVDTMLKDPNGIISYRRMMKSIDKDIKALKRERCKAYYEANNIPIPSNNDIDTQVDAILHGKKASGFCLSKPPSEEELNLEVKRILYFPYNDSQRTLMREYNEYNSIALDSVSAYEYERLPTHYQDMYNTANLVTVRTFNDGISGVKPIMGYKKKSSRFPVINDITTTTMNNFLKNTPVVGGGTRKQSRKTRTPKRNPKRKQKTIRRK